MRKYAATQPTATLGDESFAGIPSYAITGAATNRWGQGIEGVRIGFGTNTATWTTNGGGYAFRVAHGWSGTATPSYSAGGTFTPASISHSSVTANKANQNYRWTGTTYTVSGTVRNQQTGAGIGGVTVTLLPGPLTATTAASGTYTMVVEHARSGTLSASLTTGTYSPSSHDLAPLTGPRAGLDFNWLPNYAADTNTILLVHSSAANGATAFEDSSPYAHAVERIGDVVHRTATKAIGASSMQFDGLGDALSVPDSDLFDLGNQDFTLDLWVRGDRANDSAAGMTLLSQWDTDGAGFASAANWASYNALNVGGAGLNRGFAGVGFDGRYIYFVPDRTADATFHGRILRFDTRGNFAMGTDWAVYDASGTAGLNCTGYRSATFDGRYMYFAPLNNSSGNHANVLRYDTQGAFDAAGSWTAYNAGVLGANVAGYHAGVFDGRYVYFVPYKNGSTYHRNVVRYDTHGAFDAPESWMMFSPTLPAGTAGFSGGIFDGRYPE